MADGSHIENSLEISAPYWSSNAKFGSKMKNHMQI